MTSSLATDGNRPLTVTVKDASLPGMTSGPEGVSVQRHQYNFQLLSKGRTTLTRPTSKLPSIQPSCFPRFIFYVLSFYFDFFPIKVQILFHFLYVNKRHTSMNGLMSRWLHVLLNSLDSPGLTLNEMICGGPFSQLITHNATDWATRGLKHSGVNHTPSMNAWTYTLVSRFCCNPVQPS